MAGWIAAGMFAASALLGWLVALRIHRLDERRGARAQDLFTSACDSSATLHDYALMLQEHSIAPLAYECYLLEWQLAHAHEHFEEDSKQLHVLVDELHSVTEERNALKTALDKEIQRTARKAIAPKRPPNTPRATLKPRASDMAAGSDGGR